MKFFLRKIIIFSALLAFNAGKAHRNRLHQMHQGVVAAQMQLANNHAFFADVAAQGQVHGIEFIHAQPQQPVQQQEDALFQDIFNNFADQDGFAQAAPAQNWHLVMDVAAPNAHAAHNHAFAFINQQPHRANIRQNQ